MFVIDIECEVVTVSEETGSDCVINEAMVLEETSSDCIINLSPNDSNSEEILPYTDNLVDTSNIQVKVEQSSESDASFI